MRQALVIERGVSVREGDAFLAAHPGAPGTLTLSYHLDYGPRFADRFPELLHRPVA